MSECQNPACDIHGHEDTVTATVTGTYERCEECEAPFISPVPEGWTISLRNSSDGVRIMPHRAECTR